MQWQIHDRRTIYESWFVELHIARVELPDGRLIEHEVVSVPRDGAAVACVDLERGVLMIHRHRFITDQWGWELPGGLVDPGETPLEAARRECHEETGWRVDRLRHLTSMYPASGMSDQRYHVFLGEGARQVGRPTDPNEASEIAWRSFEQVTADLAAGAVPDGLAQLGLVLALTAVGRWPAPTDAAASPGVGR